MKKEIGRREFLKDAAVGVAALGTLVGCAPRVEETPVPANTEVPAAADAPQTTAAACEDEFSSFFTESSAEQGAISNATDGGEYDIIVIGAGASGVPCAVKAYQDGAKVLVLQKEATVVSQGGGCNGIEVDQSDPSAILNFIHETTKVCTYRNDREQTKVYAYSSGEAVHWYYDEAIASGYQINGAPGSVDYGDPFGKMTTFTVSVPKPDNTGTSMTSIMKAYEDKLDIRYSTPAVQLIKEGNKVTGVYGKDANGVYYKFTATKGVVLATGDYQNNEAMVARYCPDVINFERKQFHKTGDGLLMGVMAGGHLEKIGHTKMIHDFDTGPMFNEPFLRVDMNGNRFHNEDTELSVINNYMRTYGPDQAGKYCQIFDSNYEEQVTGWGGRPTDKEKLKLYMPEVEMDDRPGVLKNIIATFQADTLDELASKLGVPAENLKAAVDRYNELVDQGFDADYGKNPKFLQPINTPPFYGIHKNVRVSALCSGVVINGGFEVLDDDQNPIENLYAIGNCSGQFYGSPDYPLHFPGMSLGRCVTAGYTLGKTLAAK